VIAGEVTLDEAILQLKVWSRVDESELPTRVRDAILLGLEALKREQHRRKYDIHLPIELLPGETREH